MTDIVQRLRRLVAPLVSAAGEFGPLDSPWDRVAVPVPATAFGPGSRCAFAEYFAGESTVRVSSIDDVVEWLEQCEYVSDAELFHDRDVWQHPREFEARRRGDCEDFALWAWRKLTEIDVDAELVVGRVVCGGPAAGRQHAWVVYRLGDREFLFEPAAQSRPRMIRPLTDAMDDYVPHFAVNRHFDTCAFVGCVIDSPRADEERL